jgi:hypothetical protein
MQPGNRPPPYCSGRQGGKAVEPAFNRNATSKADTLQALAIAFDFGEALIKEQNDESMLQVVQTNQFLGPLSKARVIYCLIGPTWDIYGQMAVYLRLNGIVPPRSNRPRGATLRARSLLHESDSENDADDGDDYKAPPPHRGDHAGENCEDGCVSGIHCGSEHYPGDDKDDYEDQEIRFG